jgi:hypothetical protein
MVRNRLGVKNDVSRKYPAINRMAMIAAIGISILNSLRMLSLLLYGKDGGLH